MALNGAPKPPAAPHGARVTRARPQGEALPKTAGWGVGLGGTGSQRTRCCWGGRGHLDTHPEPPPLSSPCSPHLRCGLGRPFRPPGGDSGAAVPPRERRTRRPSALQGVSAFPPLPSGSDQSRGAQRVTPNERSASSHIRHCPLPCRIQSMLSGIGVGSSLTPRPTGTSAGHLSGLCSEASLAWGLGTNGPCWPEPPPPQPPLQ